MMKSTFFSNKMGRGSFIKALTVFLFVQMTWLTAVAQIVPTGITVSPNIPDDAATFPEGVAWYKLTIAQERFVLSYTAGQEFIPLTSTAFDATDAQLWCITGDQANGYRIYNKAAGPGKILSAASSIPGDGGLIYSTLKDIAAATAQGQSSRWDFYASNSISGATSFYLAQHGIAGHKMNNRSGKLAHWKNNQDAGSSFIFTRFASHFAYYINEIRPIASQTSTAGYVGSYTTEQFNTLNAKLTAVDNAPDNTDLQNDLITYYNSLTPIAITAGQTYILKNKHYGRYMAATNEANKKIVADVHRDENGMHQLWTFDHVSGRNYKVYNAALGAYVRYIRTESEVFQTVLPPAYTSESDMTLEAGTSFATWTIRNKNGRGCLHERDNHDVVAWETASATSWYIIPYTASNATEIAAIKDSVLKASKYQYYTNKVGGHSTQGITPLLTAWTAMQNNFSEGKAGFLSALLQARTAERTMPNPNKTYHLRNITGRYAMDFANHNKVGSSNSAPTTGDDVLLKTYAFVPTTDGAYKIINVKKGQYARAFGARETELPTTTDFNAAGNYAIIPHLDEPGTVGILDKTANDASHRYWHTAGDGRLVRWEMFNNNSLWYFEEEPTIDQVIVDDKRFVTYASGSKKTKPQNATLYKATLNGTNNWVTLTAIDQATLPANTGVIVKKDTRGSVFFINAANNANAPAITDNNLVGVTTRTQLPDNAYVLAVLSGNTPEFYAVTPGLYIPAHRAYLRLPASSTAAESLSVVFTDNGITNITSAAANKAADVYYDLMGRKVTEPKQGIYILNGKKVYIQ